MSDAPAGEQHTIPRDKSTNWVSRAVLAQDQDPVAERFRHAAIRARSALLQCKSPVLAVSSSERGEGKTTTACNLALALASIGATQKIALVDLDLRRPSVADVFGIKASVGVEDVLSGKAQPGEAAVRTEFAGLDVFPVSRPYRAAHELLSKPELGVFFQKLVQWYGIVICDTPPVLPVPDVPLLATHVGALLLVVRAGTTRRAALEDTIALLPREKIIGSFMNEAPTRRPDLDYAYLEGVEG